MWNRDILGLVLLVAAALAVGIDMAGDVRPYSRGASPSWEAFAMQVIDALSEQASLCSDPAAEARRRLPLYDDGTPRVPDRDCVVVSSAVASSLSRSPPSV
jgi:hypothetical protein